MGPRAPVVEVPEARHHVMLDQPLGFVAALRMLLDGWMRTRPERNLTEGRSHAAASGQRRPAGLLVRRRAVEPGRAAGQPGPMRAPVRANIMDHVPMVNIMPFGMCISIANPHVAAATSAALGVLTPQPCIPATASPWMPGAPTVMIANQPALDNISTCMCNWAGVITVADPGQPSMPIRVTGASAEDRGKASVRRNNCSPVAG